MKKDGDANQLQWRATGLQRLVWARLSFGEWERRQIQLDVAILESL